MAGAARGELTPSTDRATLATQASRSNERNSPFYREYFDKSPWDADPSRGDQLTHDDLMGSSIAPREPLPSRPSTAAASGVSRRTMKALEARDRAQKRAAERGWDNRFHVTLGNFANARLHHAHREYFEAPRVFDEGTKPVVPRAVDRVDSLVRPPSPRSGLGLQCIMDAGSVLGSVWSDATRSGRFDIDERGALVSREASRRQTTRRSRRSPRAKMWSEALPGEPPSRPRGAPRPTRAERRAEAERAMQDDAAQQLQLRVPAAAERVLRKKKVRERGWNDRCCTGTVTRDPVRIKLGLFKKGHRPLRDATAADLLRRPEPFDPDLMGHRRTRLSPRDGLRSIL